MMNLTPQSLRSPVSPYDQQSKQSFLSQRPWYSAAPQSNSATAGQNNQNRGLGISCCSLSRSPNTVHEMPPSPQPSDGWSHSSMMEQDFTQSSQPPNIFSAEFDPFSGYHAASNTGMMSEHTPEAPGLEYCQSPSSNLASHRSSVSSSYSPSEGYSQHDADMALTPTVKVEDASDWYPSPGNEMVTPGLSQYPHGVSPVMTSSGLLCRPPSNWSKAAAPAYPLELHHMDLSRPKFDQGPILPGTSSGDPPKKKRQKTTADEATHECGICSKLFKRSYNYKSHMETHNPDRKYHHPCTAKIGDTPCTKRFQRKTDLDRHYDSVHLKTRNHQCDLCGSRFARRDTLRRHTEDGCPKRFELGFREGSAVAPARWSLAHSQGRNRSYNLGIHPPPPMVPLSSTTPSTTFPPYGRPEYGSATASFPSVYPS